MMDQLEPESLLHSIPTSLLDYLDDLALPACVFPHSTLLGSDNVVDALLPSYQNAALKSLLSEGTKKDRAGRQVNGNSNSNGDGNHGGEGSDVEDAHKVKAHLRDALDESTRNELVDWLIEGVRTSIKTGGNRKNRSSTGDKEKLARSSSAFTTTRPRIHRDRSFQLSTDVAFAKLYWRATHNGNENDGYSVLTQLPIGHFAVRSSWEEDQLLAKSKQNGVDKPASKSLRHTRLGSDKRQLPEGRIMIGTHEVDAEKARDPNSLEGMAYTLFHAPIGIFRVNSDLSITMANPAWRNTCGQFKFTLVRRS
jgi:hypothetical protein